MTANAVLAKQHIDHTHFRHETAGGHTDTAAAARNESSGKKPSLANKNAAIRSILRNAALFKF